MKTTRSMMKWCASIVFAVGLFASPARAAQIAAWDFYTGGSMTPVSWTAEVFNANMDSTATITRGSAAAASSAANSFRTTGFKNEGISTASNDYYQITLSASEGYTLSVTSITGKMAGTGTYFASPGVSDQWAYSTDGSTFTLIGSALQSTSTNRAWDLSGVSALQNLAAGTTITLRYYASGRTSTGGWGFYSGADNSYGVDIYGSLDAAAVVPTLTSPTVTSIGQTNATLGANITDDGGDSLDERGTVYDTSANPVINGLAEGGTGTGVFSHERTGLSQGTKYYYRGYAVNGAGTGYSPDGSFYTEPGQASDIIFSLVGADTMRISWSAGPDCDGSIVVIREGNAAVADPTDGVLHDADANFGDGDDLGDGSYVVYRDSSTQVDVTGLSPNTTYYVEIFAYRGTVADSGVDQGINYRQTDPEAGNQETEDAAPEQWTNLEQRGTPVFTYYLGDYLAYQFDFAINTDTSGFTVNAGIGQSQDGAGWHWYNASYSGQDGNNRWWKSAAGEHQFDATGAWYYAGRFTTNVYTYYAANAWEANTAGPLTATNYFQVDALSGPSGVSAAKDGTYSATRADLGWTQWNSKNVLITRATAAPTGSPEPGTTYSAEDTFGNQTVVSGSQSGSSLEVTGLVPGETYYFTFYSENFSYYSTGVTADPVALDRPQARNTSGGSPEAPAGTIFLGDTGQTFGLDSWGVVDSNWGAARLWLRYNDADLAGGTPSAWSDFTDADHKTRTSGVFDQVGTWYWGMQMDYGSPYGTDFWYKADSADWADLAATGAGATLTVTVSAINDPADQDATVNATHPSSQIDLSWSKNAQGHNVLVVRKLSADSWTEPTQGTAYSAGNTLGAGTVVYNGADTGVTATGLDENTTYDFKFYSVNNDYYSPGVTAQESTGACAPAAPTGLHANPTNYTDFTANWDAVSGATGYRLDVSTEEEFGTEVTASDLIISEYFEGVSGNNKAIEIYNGTGAAVDLSNYRVWQISNGGIWPESTNFLTGTLAHGDVYVITHSSADYPNLTSVADTTSGSLNFNGDDAVGLAKNIEGTWTLIDAVGEDGADPGSGWAVAGAANATVDHSLIRKSSITGPTTNWAVSRGTTVEDSQWIVSAGGTNEHAANFGSHTFDGGTTPSFVDGFEDLAVAGTSQSVTGLVENTTYYFRVRAEGDGGCPSANSDTASVTTKENVKIEINTTSVNVREAGEGRCYVRLNKDPEGTVVVSIGRASGSETIASLVATRTFKSTTWDIWQAVPFQAAADDENTDSEEATFEFSASGLETRTVTVQTLDDDIGENIALTAGGVTVSGVRASRPGLLLDGVHMYSTNYGHTCWTNVPSGLITVDLKYTATVSRVRILNWHWDTRVHRYQIEYSSNGSDWSTLVDASGEDHRGWEDWPVADLAMRYVKFTGLSNSANQSVAIPELEIYGERDPLPVPQAVFSKTSVNVREGGVGRFFMRLDMEPVAPVKFTVARSAGDASINVSGGAVRQFDANNWNVWQLVVLTAPDDENAVGETATIQISSPGLASQYLPATALDDDIAENVALASGGATIAGGKCSRPEMLIDGIHMYSTNYGHTIWTAVPQGYMILDMHGLMTVSRVRIFNWDWTYRVHRYTIEYSTDGLDWTMLADASGSDRQGWDDWAVEDEEIRYLRFTGVSNSANSSVVIPELEVYGERPSGGRGGVASVRKASVRGFSATGSEPVSVLTSDGPEDERGWNAVDNDPETAWIGQQAGGGYVVVEYAPALTLKALEVDLAEGSLAGIEYLYSQDAEEWQPLPDDLEANPVTLNFLWLVFPDDGTAAVPELIEIRPNP